MQKLVDEGVLSQDGKGSAVRFKVVKNGATKTIAKKKAKKAASPGVEADEL